MDEKRNAEKRNAIFFNNLVLLGFNRVTFEEKYGIPFHKDMFNLPNKKAYEIVTHFLFSKLSAVTGKDYNLPWPLLNKDMERMFQKTCCALLANFSQENEVKFPRIVPSVLATFGKARFYELYLAFSSYVLKKTIRKNDNILDMLSRPNVTSENFAIVTEIVQLSTITSKKKFVDIESATHTNDLIWKKMAENSSECLQKLKQIEKSNTELLKIKTSLAAKYYCTASSKDLNLEELVEKCLHNLLLANDKMKSLDEFISNEKNMWQHLASEVGEEVENEVLNGQAINIDLIDNIPEKLKIELKKVGTCAEDGKISVIRFLKLLRVYIRFLTELINKSTSMKNICELDMGGSLPTEEVLHSINSLNKKLSEKMIPDLEESTKLLKLQHFQELESCEESLESPLTQIDSLIKLSYNPDAVMKRVMDIDPNIEENCRLYSSVNSSLDHGYCSNLSEVNTSAKTSPSNTDLPYVCKQKIQNDREDLGETSYLSECKRLLNSTPSDPDFISIPSCSDISSIPPSSDFTSIPPGFRTTPLMSNFEESIQPSFNISALEDANFFAADIDQDLNRLPNLEEGMDFKSSVKDQPVQFKWRKSWLQEEDLTTLKPEDISFVDD